MLGPEWGLSGKQTKQILQCFGPNNFLGKENKFNTFCDSCPENYIVCIYIVQSNLESIGFLQSQLFFFDNIYAIWHI